MSEFSELVRDQVDIVSVVREYVPRLRRAGTRWVAPCPFHNERTPSFGVNENLRIFKCFGCGKGGDVFKFVQEMESTTWWEAVKSLAERNGIPLPKRSQQADEDAKRRSGLFEMHEKALEFYRSQLASSAGAEARAYLVKRGVAPALADEFGIGVSDRGGQTLVRRLQQAGFPPDSIESAGLAVKRQDGSGYFDRFRGRLMFPLHSEQSKIIGFAGRALNDDDQPKYLNSPETELYQKKLVLFNLNRARKAIPKLDHAILVEGYMDVIGLHGGGVMESVASCGTALGVEQARVLKRFSENVVINFDPDPAGMNATERTIGLLLEEQLRIKVLELPDGLDPDEFVLRHGADAYRELIKRAPRYFHWLADRARGRFDMRSAEGRISAFKFLLPAIQKLHDKLERAATAEDLAAYLGVDKGMVLDQLKKTAANREAPKPAAKRPEIPQTERLLLRCLMDSGDARAEVLPRLATARFDEPPVLAGIYRAMAAAGEPLRYDALESRLEERDRSLLTDVVCADNGSNESTQETQENLLAQARSCLGALERRGLDSRIREVSAEIVEAEKAGDFARAMAALERLNELKKDSKRQRG